MKNSYASVAMFAFAAMSAVRTANAEIVDLGGESVTWTASDMKANVNNTITNGTITLSAAVGAGDIDDGTYTFGQGLELNHTVGKFIIAGSKTVKLIDGGTINWLSGAAIRFGSQYNGSTKFMLDNGHANCGTSDINIPYMDAAQAPNKTPGVTFTMNNGSTLVCAENKEVRLGVFTGNANGETINKTTSIKEIVAITNSNITAKQVRLGMGSSDYLSQPENSYLKVTFGPGTVLNVGQVYAYAYPAPTVVFDGAKICWNADAGDSIVGQNNGVARRIYTIGPNGLVIDKQSGYSRTAVSAQASALAGTGGITKTGPGDITWNSGRVGTSASEAMTFTGPLVVSNGTWTSSLAYAASGFRADGGALVLSGALTAGNVELVATAGGTLTLADATIADASPSIVLAGGGAIDYFTRDGVVASYTLDSLTLGPGALLSLDANNTSTDVISATTTNITATAESPATIKLLFSSEPASGTKFTFFEADDASKFNIVPMLGELVIPHKLTVVNGNIVLVIKPSAGFVVIVK